MQALRPLRRLCQVISSRRANAVLRYSPKSSPLIATRSLLQERSQHGNYGPHKEYFQTPGQEPKPDLTPYIREPQHQSQQSSFRVTSDTAQTAFEGQQIAVPQPRGWQRLPRLVRSLLWFVLFFELGAVMAAALITWEYMSPPFEPGSPEEQELIEEILETLDTHPMVEDLRDNEWIEVDPYTPDLQNGLKGRNMVHQVLGGNNTQGVFMKVFHHPSLEFTMLVFFLGFGIEGWPDVIHGGLISTMLQEGLSKHVAYYFPGHLTTPDNMTKIDFKRPCKPGEIYGVLVAPSGKEPVSVGNIQLTKLSMTSLMVQLVGAPSVSVEYDMQSRVETHTVRIPSSPGVEPTFAICQAEVKVVPKKLDQLNKLQIGVKDDEGFAKALDFLKNTPEFQEPPTSSEVAEEEKDED